MMNTKLIVLAAMLVASANTRAQPTRDPASSERSTAAVKPPAIDPDAIAALTRMAAFLRDQRSFTVHARRETDEVLESGQKVLLTSTITIDARRPDRLRADVTSDRKERQYFYDGKTLTLNSPRMGFYATVPAAPKIGTVLDELAQRYGIEFPLADLFYWGPRRRAPTRSRQPSTSARAESAGSTPNSTRSVSPVSTGRSGSNAAPPRCRASSR